MKMTRVTPKTYIRAESDYTFFKATQLTGGVNRLFHHRTPVPLDKQTVVRMNRDTLYSIGIVDTSGGATITMPEMPAGRYASAHLIDNDHYVPSVIYEPGTHPLPRDTKYLGIIVRIQVFDPNDPAEIDLVSQLQEQIVLQAQSADPFPKPEWDLQSLNALRAEYEEEFKKFTKYPSDWQGPRGKVNEQTRHLAAAGAWGLMPEWDATYVIYSGHHDPNVCHTATYTVPENDAFWSITMYGNDGFIKSENSIVNSATVKLNADGTFTMYFGSAETCGDVLNRLDTTDGWNFLMRIYRPGRSVLEGEYKLPAAMPVR
jgi:hypothetical protein